MWTIKYAHKTLLTIGAAVSAGACIPSENRAALSPQSHKQSYSWSFKENASLTTGRTPENLLIL